ncbi:MAG: 3-methyl-2-oxobutanoate hydroxymethyltransferase [bacterium]
MRVTVTSLREMKQRGEPITVLTAYDAPTARVLDEAGVEVILVGDSVGNVVLGYENTLPVTMDEMVHHTAAVVRGTKNAFVVFDMPFLSYQASLEDAVRNAGRAIKETGCHGVKLEGGGAQNARITEALVRTGIPVMGHLGLTPQSVHQLGGFKVQGKALAAARRMVAEAIELEKAGAFSIVLECVPWRLAQAVTERLQVPTIGIGAGPRCDGQVLVTHDMLNLSGRTPPKFVRVYADLQRTMKTAVKKYITEVRSGTFPADEHSFSMPEGVIESLPKGAGGNRRTAAKKR